jgi:hypothetical protein
VIYSEQISYAEQYSICAIASDKFTVENYGSKLDRLQKDLQINTETTMGYHRLINEAKRLT